MKWNFGTGVAAVYSVFALSMLGAAIRSTHYDVGLVKPNYYDDDLNYQQRFDKELNEKSSSARVHIRLDKARGVLIIDFPKDQLSPAGKVTLFRPSKKGLDQILSISTNAANTMETSTRNLAGGLWKVQIDWSSQGAEYYKETYLKI